MTQPFVVAFVPGVTPGKWARVWAERMPRHPLTLTPLSQAEAVGALATREVDAVFRDRDHWSRMSLLNTARSGWFSSDRTIRGYMNDVWDAKAVLQA